MYGLFVDIKIIETLEKKNTARFNTSALSDGIMC